MKKLVIFFILASGLSQGPIHAMATYGSLGEAEGALDSAIRSGNSAQAQMVLQRLGSWSSNPALQSYIQRVKALAGEAPVKVLPVEKVDQAVLDAAAAVKTAANAVQTAGQGLSSAQKKQVNDAAGMVLLK